MDTLMQASRQWATRPGDERFISLLDLQRYTQHVRQTSRSKIVSTRAISVAPVEDDNNGLAIVSPNGHISTPTHWAFTQLTQRAGCPANYMRKLPSPLAADCLNYGLTSRDADDIGVLVQRDNPSSPVSVNAVTGPNYGRVWNSTIVDSLVNRFGDGVTGDFRVPGEFGKALDTVTKENTTLYASDRDMFVFLADEKNRIEVPDRRDGQSGSMARGFFVWNSEVGSASFGVSTFLFDYVCCNRIVWGPAEYKEIRIRHTQSAPHRWIEEVAPAIQAYAESSTQSIDTALQQVRRARIDNIDKFLTKRFTKSQTTAIQKAHMIDEQRPIETMWDAVTGITAYARSIPHQNERIVLEREAGKLLDMAA